MENPFPTPATFTSFTVDRCRLIFSLDASYGGQARGEVYHSDCTGVSGGLESNPRCRYHPSGY